MLKNIFYIKKKINNKIKLKNIYFNKIKKKEIKNIWEKIKRFKKQKVILRRKKKNLKSYFLNKDKKEMVFNKYFLLKQGQKNVEKVFVRYSLKKIDKIPVKS